MKFKHGCGDTLSVYHTSSSYMSTVVPPVVPPCCMEWSTRSVQSKIDPRKHRRNNCSRNTICGSQGAHHRRRFGMCGSTRFLTLHHNPCLSAFPPGSRSFPPLGPFSTGFLAASASTSDKQRRREGTHPQNRMVALTVHR